MMMSELEMQQHPRSGNVLLPMCKYVERTGLRRACSLPVHERGHKRGYISVACLANHQWVWCAACCDCKTKTGEVARMGCENSQHWMERDSFDTGKRNHLQRHRPLGKDTGILAKKQRRCDSDEPCCKVSPSSTPSRTFPAPMSCGAADQRCVGCMPTAKPGSDPMVASASDPVSIPQSFMCSNGAGNYSIFTVVTGPNNNQMLVPATQQIAHFGSHTQAITFLQPSPASGCCTQMLQTNQPSVVRVEPQNNQVYTILELPVQAKTQTQPQPQMCTSSPHSDTEAPSTAPHSPKEPVPHSPTTQQVENPPPSARPPALHMHYSTAAEDDSDVRLLQHCKRMDRKLTNMESKHKRTCCPCELRIRVHKRGYLAVSCTAGHQWVWCSLCCDCREGKGIGCFNAHHWMERDSFDTGKRNHLQRHLANYDARQDEEGSALKDLDPRQVAMIEKKPVGQDKIRNQEVFPPQDGSNSAQSPVVVMAEQPRVLKLASKQDHARKSAFAEVLSRSGTSTGLSRPGSIALGTTLPPPTGSVANSKISIWNLTNAEQKAVGAVLQRGLQTTVAAASEQSRVNVISNVNFSNTQAPKFDRRTSTLDALAHAAMREIINFKSVST